MESAEIEAILQETGLRYTKEVCPGIGDSYSVPFELPDQVINLSVSADEESFNAGCFLRRMDSLALETSEKSLLLGLLRLNAPPYYARVFLHVSSEDDSDWIGVTASLPLESLTSGTALGVILDAAELAGKAVELIFAHTRNRQRQIE